MPKHRHTYGRLGIHDLNEFGIVGRNSRRQQTDIYWRVYLGNIRYNPIHDQIKIIRSGIVYGTNSQSRLTYFNHCKVLTISRNLILVLLIDFAHDFASFNHFVNRFS